MIAVDAMGGDFAPRAIVQGAYQAAIKGIPILLCGDEDQIIAILNSISVDSKEIWPSLPISIHHTTQIISMGAEPSKSVLQENDSSLVQAVRSVAQGKAQAVVSAGNSGAALVAGTLILQRVDGILRPAIGSFLPTKSSSIFCIDIGANTDCKPEYLEQFALMGHIYVSMIKNKARPRIALLSNGAEPYKGSQSVKQAYDLLIKSKLNFVGNLEPREIFDDQADVIVCDGFTGNIMLKTVQGTAKAMVYWIDQERKKSLWHSIGLLLSKGLFKGLKQKIDYAKKGGALLFGVQHPLIIAHGCSNATAIENAILYAQSVVDNQIISRFNAQLADYLSAQGITDSYIAAQRAQSFDQQQL
jgi:glycerol-3-phosphate acyltransferase PlsX